jgi:hypothetical protein
MPAAIGHRECPGRDGESLLRGIAGRRLPFAGEHLRNVIVERNRLDANPAVGESTAESKQLARVCGLNRLRRLNKWEMRGEK